MSRNPTYSVNESTTQGAQFTSVSFSLQSISFYFHILIVFQHMKPGLAQILKQFHKDFPVTTSAINAQCLGTQNHISYVCNAHDVVMWMPALPCRYVHQQDWDAAQKVAETYAPESVSDVLIGQVGSSLPSHTNIHILPFLFFSLLFFCFLGIRMFMSFSLRLG